MIRTIQIIYDRLNYAHCYTASSHIAPMVECSQAIIFLLEKAKIDPLNKFYPKLISHIKIIKDKYIPVGCIEKFCISELSEQILSQYPINIGEAFILSYVALNKPVLLNMVYLKLGTSGLLSPTVINGTRIDDIEAIAKFMLNSLASVDLIRITENQFVLLGKNFQLA